MARFPDLPEDMLVEILSWLPPGSLLRFKCVKRSWHTLINALVKNPKFVAKHLCNSRYSTSSLLYECSDEDGYRAGRGSLTIFNDGDNGEHLSYFIEDFVTLFVEQCECFGNFCFVGSNCNGIVCLVDYLRGIILLCNPETREHKLLPGPCHENGARHALRVGFGYDSVADVYKVVRIFGWFGDLKAQVYALGNNSWREIDVQIETKDHSVDYTCKEVYSKGVYYWLVISYCNQEIVYSFDMHDETFCTIELPENCQGTEFISVYNTNLTQWNESVVLFCYPEPRWTTTRPMEMWLLHESLEDRRCSCCWTKHLSIGPLDGIYRTPIAFWKSDEILMIEDKKCLVSYNLHTDKVRSLHKEDRIMTTFRAFPCVKSLVSVTEEMPLTTKLIRRSHKS